MELRIHHFFDIIRDFGSGKNIVPHEYGHAYHKVAEQIMGNVNLEFELVIGSDEICKGCSQLKDGDCIDLISHRQDFIGKEEFNNHLDSRIMENCGFENSKMYTPKQLCELAGNYINNIQFIYKGNDVEHTEIRKQNVISGLRYYSEKHGFVLHI